MIHSLCIEADGTEVIESASISFKLTHKKKMGVKGRITKAKSRRIVETYVRQNIVFNTRSVFA